MRKLLQPLKSLGAVPGVPFHMELYALWPEKFGAYRPGPMPRPTTLTPQQLRGERWLRGLRLLLLITTLMGFLGLLVVAWNFLTLDPTPVPHPSDTPGQSRPF